MQKYEIVYNISKKCAKLCKLCRPNIWTLYVMKMAIATEKNLYVSAQIRV